MSPLTGLRKRIRRICRNKVSDSLLLRISDPNRLIKRKIVFRGFRENRVAGFRTVGKDALFVSRNRAVGFEEIVVAAGRTVRNKGIVMGGIDQIPITVDADFIPGMRPFRIGIPRSRKCRSGDGDGGNAATHQQVLKRNGVSLTDHITDFGFGIVKRIQKRSSQVAVTAGIHGAVSDRCQKSVVEGSDLLRRCHIPVDGIQNR